MGNAFIIQFELMIINNWQVNARTHTMNSAGQYSHIFFICFYIFTVIFGINIIVAIIIEWTTQIITYFQSKDKMNILGKPK